MQNGIHDWQGWERLFESRADRPLPRLAGRQSRDIPASVARSLAIFQLGESGGGTVVDQAKASRLPGTDDHYCEALRLFVAEEHRHANLLAMCVRMLGGELIRENWTARLFVTFRRLIGIRTKVMVLLAAEVVGICFYRLIAEHLPAGPVRQILLELVDDEETHLRFHAGFLRTQMRYRWQRALFRAAWRVTMACACAAVMLDHRATMRDLGIGAGAIWRRTRGITERAEVAVVAQEQQIESITGALDEELNQSVLRVTGFGNESAETPWPPCSKSHG